MGVAGVVGLVVVACASNEAPRGGPRACSTGPAYPFETAFATVDDLGASLPVCTPRCAFREADVPANFANARYSIEALPSGSCSVDGDTCRMAAVRVRTCPSGERVSCSFTGYRCTCEGGAWRCVSGPQGASACVCPQDAGTP